MLTDCKVYLFFRLQIEKTLELEQRVANLRLQNGQLKEENGALRKLMEDQSHAHSQHLRAYQGGQERQAELVQQLQAKVGGTAG